MAGDKHELRIRNSGLGSELEGRYELGSILELVQEGDAGVQEAERRLVALLSKVVFHFDNGPPPAGCALGLVDGVARKRGGDEDLHFALLHQALGLQLR